MFKKIALISFLSVPAIVFAYANPGQPAGFVNDFAGVLSAEQKTALETKLVDFEKNSGNEISVVTVKNLGGDSIENFAVKLFEDWGLGKEKEDNGVLILVAEEDREMRIEVGYGLEGALTDAQSYWIIKNLMAPAFSSGNFYLGMDNAVDKIIDATKREYVPSEKSDAGNGVNWLFLIVFLPIWLASILARSKSWWLGGVIGGIAGIIIGFIKGFLYFGLGSMAVFIPLGLLFDYLVSKNYQKVRSRGGIPPWWMGGSGRGGGGGFGGFGGGMSGGGGASGRW